MKDIIKNAILTATTKQVAGDRTFFPHTSEGTTPRKPAVKVGFIPMTGGNTPGGLNITVLQDIEDKLLVYFLLGGTAEELDENLMDAFIDDDKVVIIGTDLNQSLRAGFMVDKFDRQIDQVIKFPKYDSEWGIEDVINHTFLNAKLYDTFDA